MWGTARQLEIAVRLQQLRETRARELAAFDVLADDHPELSAAEIAALAQQKAEAEKEQSLTVNGVTVSVGATVRVKDDIDALHRADRGYIPADPLKPVYLGEKGCVVDVMRSYGGKPAVALRFADGVTKVFYVECLDLGQKSDDAGSGVTGRAAARHSDPREEVTGSLSEVVVPSTPPPPKAEALPGWAQLSMPHRRPSASSSGGAIPVAVSSVPPPPPVFPEVRGASAKRVAPTPTRGSSSISASAASASSPAAELPVKKSTSEARKRPTAVVPAARAVVKKEPPRGSCRPLHLVHAGSVLATAVADQAQPSILSAATVGSGAEDGLGSPMSFAENGLPRRASAAADSEGIPDLRPTPDSSLFDMGESEEATAATDGVEVEFGNAAEATAVPGHETPVTRKQRLSDTGDEVAILEQGQLAGAKISGTRLCWIVGLSAPGGKLSEPLRIFLQAQCTTMFAVFAAINRKLRWDKQRLTATRLFTEKGVEIKSAGAVHSGMRLVATAGCAYKPEGVTSPFAAVGDARHTSGRATKAASNNPTSAATRTAAASAASSSSANTGGLPFSAPASPVKKATPLSKQPNAVTGRKRIAPPPVASAKPIHIRVYENGLYDDNIYRTITVRPTYKTLGALKTVITRELQWRDGKKVSLLFDASGAEVVELHDLLDGDAVVASAGDRFVIPYPNTAIHKEAVKLSERLR
ncbi:hypothetical protein LSCM1_04547 [Leishmania martiniquensis]|uniref:Doublecortin domain-containing protein n=1 Tax=Leishmania martiniquensis TaxID=1580590 RepID=A0A836GTZ6_9TRYP|nr:hypothetical protein LSCM1_04547 [Leishmania martiniquensis]